MSNYVKTHKAHTRNTIIVFLIQSSNSLIKIKLIKSIVHIFAII